MRCDMIDEKLEAFVDGELSAHERDRIEAHLGDCRLCRENLESRLDMRRMFRQEIQEPTPESLRGRVLHAAEANAAEQRSADAASSPTSRRWIPSGRTLVWATAAILVVTFLGIGVFEDGGNGLGDFSTPSQVVVLRYGERPGKQTPVKFGGIELSRSSGRRSQ